MPMVQVNLLKGYDAATKEWMAQELTHCLRGITQAVPDGISVWMNEFESEDYFRAGEVRQPGPAATHPAQLVHEFLAAMEARDLDLAATYLADDFIMCFPGAQPFRKLEELVNWARGRYQAVYKNFSDTSVAYQRDRVVVTCHGLLHGHWLTGESFEGVRFIDRFEIQANKLVRQDVWNDLALVSNHKG